ncbi:(d)CMP kinase [Microbacterium allomyrinae]|uniref:Cytidylate kinase n=1 Tax=Microbacterium allomyrinae TaxID=2830666 RepID=A0A9X1LU04_9MICO|nr:(d)CMP kinase [Microbacterium allomyrinae]MCC2031787.1 (d)CMP kinase [Microbacterium allomyrinae]
MTDSSPESVTEDGAPVGSAPVIVAIDGPAGSGKSSVSKQVARRLGYGYLDTGAAYRALAWHALEHGIDTSDAASVLDVAGDFDYSISLDPDSYWVRVGATDVTEAIRDPRVTDAVSGVARVPVVRQTVNALFRALVAESRRAGVVIEGRDITTVVAPDAPVRILLTAAPEVRAARRSAEVTTQDAAAVAAALHKRDTSDSAVVDFLTAAPGVEVVDSTDLDFDQTVDAVLGVIRGALPRATADPVQTGARNGI